MDHDRLVAQRLDRGACVREPLLQAADLHRTDRLVAGLGVHKRMRRLKKALGDALAHAALGEALGQPVWRLPGPRAPMLAHALRRDDPGRLGGCTFAGPAETCAPAGCPHGLPTRRCRHTPRRGAAVASPAWVQRLLTNHEIR